LSDEVVGEFIAFITTALLDESERAEPGAIDMRNEV
jgi:hypothetical protein